MERSTVTDTAQARPQKGLTFVVNVTHTENATWQGSIAWLEGKETCCFRSILEMLQLMEQAQA